MGRAGHHVRRKTRIVRLFEEQGGKCAYCGAEMTLTLGFNRTATKDHVVPRSYGGPTEAWNLVGACFSCNSKKGSRPLEVFLTTLTGGKPEQHPLYRRIHHDHRTRLGRDAQHVA